MLYSLCLIGALESAWAQGSLTEALDNPELSWTAGGNGEWKVVSRVDSHAGPSVAEVRLESFDPGFGFPPDCQRSWMETTVSGPGVFAIWARHNNNPYSRVELFVDGIRGEAWDLDWGWGHQPDDGYSDWRRLTAPLTAGPHTIRVEHGFGGCYEVGTLFIQNPSVQVDDARVLPPLSDDLLAAIEVPPGGTWLAGGDADFVRLGAGAAHDGIDALRGEALPGGWLVRNRVSAWLQRDVSGPVTLAWWERSLSPWPKVVPDGEWIRRDLFVPPGPHRYRWTQVPFGQDLDEFSEAAAPETPLGESLDSGDRAFAQGGGSWQGVLTSAAPDGVDAAWTRVFPGAPSWLETVVDGPATLQFRTASSIETLGRISLSLNDRTIVVPDASFSALLPQGRHRLRWTASSSAWENAGALPGVVLLDQVRVGPEAERTLGDALDAPELTWTTSAPAWIGMESSAAPDGDDAAVAPALSLGEAAWIETHVAGTGRLQFRWPLADQSIYSSQPTPLSLIVDSRHVIQQQVDQPSPLVEVGPGDHTFRWLATGQADWRVPVLDQVTWTPLPASPRLQALDGLSGPIFAPRESLTSVVTDITHDGTDALKIEPASESWQGAPSLITWMEGPGHAFFWWNPSDGVILTVDGGTLLPFQLDNGWRRGILFVPPGSRGLEWRVIINGLGAPEHRVMLDELTFAPAPLIPLATALAPLGPWRTSQERSWLGLPASFILTTTPSVHAGAGGPSWLETDLTGPAVVSFTATGAGLTWSVDGEFVSGVSSYSPTIRQALYVPAGSRAVRWQNSGDAASLSSMTVHAMHGDVSVQLSGEALLIRVPRPAGLTDSQISIQYASQWGGTMAWSLQYSARVVASTPDAVSFRLVRRDDGTSLYRAAFVVAP